MNTKSKGLRIYSLARFLTFITILVVVAFLAGGLIFKSTVSGMEEPKYETVTIMAGDTLWDIASDYNSDRNDLRNLVKEICSVNDINNCEIHPGQTIKIPVV